MAKQLWLLRHGEAVPHGSRPSDDERELTARGEQQSRAAGRALARLGIEFAAAYTSPKVRGRDTARLACEPLGLEPEEVGALHGGFDREDADDLLLAHPDGACILVVGHEPDFSQVVHDVTGARLDFKKGGVAAVKMGRGDGELLVVLRPRELATIAGG